MKEKRKEKTYFCDTCNKLYIGEREIFLFYSERKTPLRVCESCADSMQQTTTKEGINNK